MRAFRTLPVLWVTGALGLAATVSGCVLAPRSLHEEHDRLATAGQAFEPSLEKRELPELPAEPEWTDVLRRAFLANGALEAAYFEWKAAVERVRIAAAYPNTNVALSYQYLFSGGNMKAWDRSTFTAGFDPMQNLSFPTKVMAAGRVALDDARAAGRRFQAAKFGLQQQVLTAYLDYALLAEKLRLQQENLALLQMAAQSAAARLQSGASQQEVVNAQLETQLADDELRSLEAEAPQAQAMLNALLGRAPDDPLPLPSHLPAPRGLQVDTAELLRVAGDHNPELAAFAAQAAGRADALELARQQFIPDINPFAGFTGSIEQFAGAMLILPTTVPRIRSAINEARATLRQSEATLRQARLDRSASLVAALHAMRNSERQAVLFEQQIVPASDLMLANARQRYANSSATLAEVVAGQRAVIEARLARAEARMAREKRLAEIETLVGVDIETLDATARTRLAAVTSEVVP